MKIKLVLVSVLAFAVLNSCVNEKTNYDYIEGFTQGTTYHITYCTDFAKIDKSEVDSILHDFDLSLSTYKPESIISKINRNEKNILVDDYFKAVFLKSMEISEKTNGFFDITVSPLVNAWGFGTEKRESPDSCKIDSILKFVGYKKVRLSNDSVIKTKPEVKLDVNAIAQGYSVDVLVQYFEKRGIRNYVIEIGGELKAKGINKNGTLWRIGIDKPIDDSTATNREIQEILLLNDKALATSGNYRKYFIKNGVKYAHTINPKTGYPVERNLLSATVLANDCMTADAYATAFMVMGLEKSIEFVENNQWLDVYLIYSDKNGNFRVYYTDNLKKMIKPAD